MRQTRRAARRTSSAGIGIDRFGGPVIDPTENVLALVDVEKEHQKQIREADHKAAAMLRQADLDWWNKLQIVEKQRLDDIRLLNRQLVELANRYQDEARQADKLNQKTLDEIRSSCEHRLSEMAAAYTKEQSSLLATQLERFSNTLGERLTRLEQFRYEITGKTAGRSDILSYVIAIVSMMIAAAAVLWRTHG